MKEPIRLEFSGDEYFKLWVRGREFAKTNLPPVKAIVLGRFEKIEPYWISTIWRVKDFLGEDSFMVCGILERSKDSVPFGKVVQTLAFTKTDAICEVRETLDLYELITSFKPTHQVLLDEGIPRVAGVQEIIVPRLG